MKLCKLAPAITLPLLLGWAGLSFATIWVEKGDAGDIPSTAQVTIGQTPLTGISGHLDFDVTTGTYDVDLFKIFISNPLLFSASTTAGSANIFDPALWLFDSSGKGVYMNDDRSPSNLQALLPSFNPLGPMSPGQYYLAITWTFYDAISNILDPFSSIFPVYQSFLPTDGVYGPTGNGGAAPLAGWTPDSPRQDLPSNYLIALTGAQFSVPEPSMLLLFGVAVLCAAAARRRRV